MSPPGVASGSDARVLGCGDDGGGGVLCGVAVPDDLPPGVGGGVGNGDGGTLAGGVISPSGGRMIAVPAAPLC